MTNEEVRQKNKRFADRLAVWLHPRRSPTSSCTGLKNQIAQFIDEDQPLLHAYNAGVEDAARASWDAIHELDPSGRFHDAQEVANTAIRDLKLCEGDDDGTNGC